MKTSTVWNFQSWEVSHPEPRLGEGTHDLSPIFQSVSHAYQLCNKVSKEPHVLIFFCAGSTTLVQEKKKSFWAKNAHSIPNSKDTKNIFRYLLLFIYVWFYYITVLKTIHAEISDQRPLVEFLKIFLISDSHRFLF